MSNGMTLKSSRETEAKRVRFRDPSKFTINETSRLRNGFLDFEIG